MILVFIKRKSDSGKRSAADYFMACFSFGFASLTELSGRSALANVSERMESLKIRPAVPPPSPPILLTPTLGLTFLFWQIYSPLQRMIPW